jgi:hypothetical protein
MASRKKPRKAPTDGNGLVPALRDAVADIDRALAALGRRPGRKRATRGKPRKS